MIERIRCAWNILRGRPTAYRVRVEDGGFRVVEDYTRIVGCTVIGARVGIHVVSSHGYRLEGNTILGGDG